MGDLYAMHKGNHLLVDCTNVPQSVCTNDKLVMETFSEAAKEAGATVISQVRYKFDGIKSPNGFTVVVMLDESHISAHSYSDEGMLAMDIFTCGSTDPQNVFDIIASKLDLGTVNVNRHPRF
jgi:S-adenosylmethionine decarboxylase